ncbi:MAG: GNAT family N-acetyltransferase [Clostridia bacterium]|nr:GNAT family N-acetyltransferase [Clostridia bacterium]
MSDLYLGRGVGFDRGDYLDFINLVFGFNGNDRDFLKLLPGLYKEQYDPCYNNFVAAENGKLRAAIGVYPRKFSVMGEELLSHGIGNVAVHPYHRGKGYMKTLMNMALDDMIDAGADFSDLGGQRQRYQYFGYDNAGCARVFSINRTNIRHNFPDAPETAVYFHEIDETSPYLDDIHALYSSRTVHTVRPRAALYDILCAGYDRPCVILSREDNRFCGFFTGALGGLALTDNGLFCDVVREYLKFHNDVDIHLAPYDTDLIPICHRIGAGCRITSNVKIAVFRFGRMLSAYLALKAATEGLVDGVRQYTITGINAGHGKTRDESFRICVENGKSDISAIHVDEPVTVLPYMDALAYFFGLAAPERISDPTASQWFPLPVQIDGCDHV